MNDMQISKNILGLIFYRAINKITQSKETLILHLYPYLRETKKQVLIEEGMKSRGSTFLELCKVVNYFFSWNEDYFKEKASGTGAQLWGELQSYINSTLRPKSAEILMHLKDCNSMMPKLLPIKHFENTLFHSLNSYDLQIRVKKAKLIEMFKSMR